MHTLNIFTTIERGLTAKSLALFTALSILLSFMPAGVFVAQAVAIATPTIETQDAPKVSYAPDEEVPMKAARNGFSVGDSITVNLTSDNGGVFSAGNLAGNCTGSFDQTSVTIASNSDNKGFCYKNSTAGPDTITATFTDENSGEEVDTYEILITVNDGVLDSKDSVDICHSANGKSYQSISPNVDAIVTLPNGHDNHDFDIIPPFSYDLGQGVEQYPGKNWDTDGQEIYRNDCVDEDADPVEPLTLTSMCIYEDGSALWRVRNDKNDFDVDYTWEIVNNQETGGPLTATHGPKFGAGDTFFTSDKQGTMKIYWDDEEGKEQFTTKASGNKPCAGTIIVEKLTPEEGENTTFDFSGDLGEFDLLGNASTSFSVAPGEYTITEDVLEGWTLASLSCDVDGEVVDGTSVTVSLEAEQTITCEFGNRPEKGEVYQCEAGLLFLDTESDDPDSMSLYTVDETDGSATFWAEYDIDLHSAMAVDVTGVIYSIEEGTGNLVTLDDDAGATSVVGPTGLNAGKPVAMEIAPDGTLYVLTQDSDKLYSVDTATGAATELKDLDLNVDGGDIVFEGELIYYVKNTGEVYAIDPNNSFAESLVGTITVGNKRITSAATKDGVHYAYTREDSFHPFTLNPFVEDAAILNTGEFAWGDGSYCAAEPVRTCTVEIVSDETNTVVEKGGAFAKALSYIHPAWTAVIGGATWIWGDDPVVDPVNEETQTFLSQFGFSGDVTKATLYVASDNSHAATLNGDAAGADASENNHALATQDEYDVTSLINQGNNDLSVAVTNWAGNADPKKNPAGLLYKLEIEGLITDDADCVVPYEDEPEDPWCSFTGAVIDYTANEDAKKNNGNPVDANRRDVTAVETIADYQNTNGKEPTWSTDDFFSLGIGGFLTYEFTGAVAFDQAGPDIAIYEITGGPTNQVSGEKVEVFVSQNGVNFLSLGTFTGDAEVDIAPAGLDYVKYVKLVDQSQGVQGGNGDGYDVDAIVILTGSCGEEPEESKVTICKYDEEQNPLPGWTLMLKGDFVEDIEVSATSNVGTDTTSLVGGQSYIALASGTWDNNRGPLNIVDAEYSTEDNWLTQMDGFDGFPTDILELFIDGESDPNSNWGTYNSNHTYAQSFVPGVDGPVNFAINDTFYGDNAGSLDVSIYTGYAGITDENGCVTFDDVPHGTYDIDEIMLDGWENVSGLEEIDVMDDVRHAVVNTDDTEPKLTCEPGVNLLANGDFEEPIVTDGAKWDIFSTGIGWLVDWVAPNGDAPEVATLELHRGVNGWLPSEGAQYAELDGDYQGPGGGNGEPASTEISQTVPTIDGQKYTLTWDFSPRPNTNESDNNLEVYVDGVKEKDIDSPGGNQTAWASHSFTFTADEETEVMFKDGGMSNSLGTFLDNVALTCEPTTPYGDYCGDGQINQEWEQCEVGDEGCTQMCTFENQCSVEQLVKIDLDDTVTESASFDGKIYLGSASNPIPAGVWFKWNVAGDDDAATIANAVDGLAVERDQINGLQLAFTGDNARRELDFAQGSIEFMNLTTGVITEYLLGSLGFGGLEDGSGGTFDDVFEKDGTTKIDFDMRADTGDDSVTLGLNVDQKAIDACLPVDEFTLTVEIEGDGFGGVFSDDQHIQCATEDGGENLCEFTYPAGTVVDLTATPESGSNFDNSWTVGAGTCTSDTSPCQVTMNSDIDLIAKFDLDQTQTTVFRGGRAGSDVSLTNETPDDSEDGGSGGDLPLPDVLGAQDQVSVIPTGAPNAGAGGAATAAVPMTIAVAIFALLAMLGVRRYAR